jgi:hypothetical protein
MQSSAPISYLDAAIVRVALLRAHKLLQQGQSIEEALNLACPGAWSELRRLVKSELTPTADR